MKPSHIAALAVGLAIACPGAAFAQAYKWRDEKGGIVFSDTPPPPSIPRANILQGPKGKFVSAPVAASGAPVSGSAAVSAKAESSAPKTTAEREADYRKRQLEAQKKTKETDEKSAQEQQRQANCESLRQHLVSLESGQRIARTDSKGERFFVDDEQRAKDIVKARQDLAASKCN